MYFHSIAGTVTPPPTCTYLPRLFRLFPALHLPNGVHCATALGAMETGQDGTDVRRCQQGGGDLFQHFHQTAVYSEHRSISQNVYMLQLHVTHDKRKQKKTKETNKKDKDDGKTIPRTCTGGCFLAGALSVWPEPQSRRATCLTAGSAENEKVVSISPYVLSTGQEY